MTYCLFSRFGASRKMHTIAIVSLTLGPPVATIRGASRSRPRLESAGDPDGVKECPSRPDRQRHFRVLRRWFLAPRHPHEPLSGEADRGSSTPEYARHAPIGLR